MPPDDEPARGQRGQSSAEYAGVIVLVATVILLLSTSGFGDDITSMLRDAVSDITGGGR